MNLTVENPIQTQNFNATVFEGMTTNIPVLTSDSDAILGATMTVASVNGENLQDGTRVLMQTVLLNMCQIMM